ncbi:hypothetical protein JOQ06_015652, partial [Pogonophryne albipinna]
MDTNGKAAKPEKEEDIKEMATLKKEANTHVLSGIGLDERERRYRKCQMRKGVKMITGFQVPPPVTSTGNVFSLRLTSDFAVSAHGFKLNYEELHSTSCGNPGVPPKALLSGAGRFAVGDSVQYSCVPGYVLDGHATLTCITNAGNTAVWDFPAPICR